IDTSLSNERINNICNFIYRDKPTQEPYPCTTCFETFENMRMKLDAGFVTRVVKCQKCSSKTRLDFRNNTLFEYRRLTHDIS
ncbi:MAG: hypothetical protein ACUZ8H_13710, partial [Candidatus Anammoxibacter sp.]